MYEMHKKHILKSLVCVREVPGTTTADSVIFFILFKQTPASVFQNGPRMLLPVSFPIQSYSSMLYSLYTEQISAPSNAAVE
jgi:hypothetical protein